MKRAAEAAMGKQRSAMIEEHLSQLAALDLRLLHWLLRYPFQRADDLVIGVARWASRPTVYRHASALQHKGLIESVLPATPGAGKHLYFLSNLGLHILAARVHVSPKELAREWQADEPGLLRLLPRLPTLLVIQDFVNGIVCQASHTMARQGRRPSLIRWDWQRDYAYRFLYREHVTKLTVDGAFAMCVRSTLLEHRHLDQWYGLLVLHTSFHNERLMRLRLERILRWRECPERWPLYQHMPPVVVLAVSARQSESWRHCAEEVAVKLRCHPLEGTIACLSFGESEMPNPWLLPWRTLATNALCHLQDVLQPLPLAAIPAALHPDEDEAGDGSSELPTTPGESSASLLAARSRISTIITGNFASRTTRARRESDDEREAMALLGLRLTPRLWGLLHLLLDHPLLSASDLAALLDVQLGSVRCFLYELHRLECSEPVITEVGQRWRLSGRGLRVMAAAHHFSVRNLAFIPEDEASDLMQRGQEWLLHRIRHTAGIYGFFASLSQSASKERSQQQALLWWETGATCERRYRVHDRWYNLKPDALAEYQRGEQCYRFWLEWDRGTMNARDLAVKFTSYAQYVASREWARERTVLPVLLCVAPDIAQEQRMHRVAQARLAGTPGLVMHSTTASLLSAQGPLAAIWLQGFPRMNQPAASGSLRRSWFGPRESRVH